MNNSHFQDNLILKIEDRLNVHIIDMQDAPQGMGSYVIFAKDNKGQEYAIKCGKNLTNEKLTFNLLKENKINIPIPKVIDNFLYEDKSVIILEKIEYPLLESVPINQMYRYIPSMIKNLKELHQIKSDKAGLLIETNGKMNWKQVLASNFNGHNRDLNWKDITERESLDKDVISHSVQKINELIEKTDMMNNSYSFLHTDFNQRNLFINPDSDDLAAIIDWNEAIFGDPIYDFARVRMYIWHFKLGKTVLDNYYKLISLTAEQKKLEEVYFLSRIIEYLAYYSEELNEFNIGRIRLHQDFLRSYKW